MQIDLTNNSLYQNIDTVFHNNNSNIPFYGDPPKQWAYDIVINTFPDYYMTAPVGLFDGNIITAKSARIITFTNAEFEKEMLTIKHEYGVVLPYQLSYDSNLNFFIFRFGHL